jgi:major vault protein
MSQSLFRVPPFYYVHVLDNNTNVTRIITGPTTFTKQDHEKLVVGPLPMIVVPVRHYCVVKNPAIRENGEYKTDKHGQVQLRHGDLEIRFNEDWPEPFPLVPGEKFEGKVELCQLVLVDTALRLVAKRDFYDEQESVERNAGDEWLFVGPATYRPRVEVKIVEEIYAQVITTDRALRLKAKHQFTCKRTGKDRKAGEEWLVRTPGSYLPSVYEEVIGIVEPWTITPYFALHLSALETFEDVYGVTRHAGQEWLVDSTQSELHIPDVHEVVVGHVNISILSKNQYCVVLNPVKNGQNQLGCRELREGPQQFFLQPGESIEGNKLQDANCLGQQEALLLKALEPFTDTFDGQEVKRTPGDLWMVSGPCYYVPPVEVEVKEKRSRIPLDDNEGIYVRNIKTGKVRVVSGQSYMLTEEEELWEKELSADVENLLSWSYYGGLDKKQAKAPKRDKTRVVVFRVPHNAAVQIHDYKTDTPRVVMGPSLVMLAPDEEFTLLSLSGAKPKRPNVIKSLALMLGPDFMTDILEVETADHARLRLQLSYNWHFDWAKDDTPNADAINAQLFQVPDFVGDACKAIASLVRGAAAACSFDEFHKNSARIIRVAVFGYDKETKKIGNKFTFNSNRLCITNIDIQSVEPVDEHTRESLQKSVQLAIEITTRKLERSARHQAEQTQQKAKGLIARQKIENSTEAEQQNQILVQLQAECAAVASSGTAMAEAEAKAEYLEIQVKSDVEQAEFQTQAEAILQQAELEAENQLQVAEVEHETAMTEIELKKEQDLAEIETKKFAALVDSITPQTIQAIARAGPEMQARLLKGLGLKGYLLTDGNSPVNLFNTAQGMVGPQ